MGGDLFIADARGGLRSVRLREELLYGSFARDAVERGLEPVSERTTLRLPPGAAPFRVTLAVPSPSGVLVALCGYSSPDNCACVRVLDLSRTDLARRTGGCCSCAAHAVTFDTMARTRSSPSEHRATSPCKSRHGTCHPV